MIWIVPSFCSPDKQYYYTNSVESSKMSWKGLNNDTTIRENVVPRKTSDIIKIAYSM